MSSFLQKEISFSYWIIKRKIFIGDIFTINNNKIKGFVERVQLMQQITILWKINCLLKNKRNTTKNMLLNRTNMSLRQEVGCCLAGIHDSWSDHTIFILLFDHLRTLYAHEVKGEGRYRHSYIKLSKLKDWSCQNSCQFLLVFADTLHFRDFDLILFVLVFCLWKIFD